VLRNISVTQKCEITKYMKRKKLNGIHETKPEQNLGNETKFYLCSLFFVSRNSEISRNQKRKEMETLSMNKRLKNVTCNLSNLLSLYKLVTF
jgi:tRNA G10  N-methylase Trm11